VLAGLGRGDGALWVGVGETTPVGNVQRAEWKRGGSGRVLPLLLHVSRLGSGQGRLGLDRGDVHEHGYRAGAKVNSVGHSDFDFSGFLPTRCSTQCPQETQIRIFENFHFGWSTY
jgi:hypothetical protein